MNEVLREKKNTYSHMEARCSHVHEVKICIRYTKHGAIYRWTFIDVAHENTSLVFRDARRTMVIGRRIDDKSQSLVTRGQHAGTTAFHYSIDFANCTLIFV